VGQARLRSSFIYLANAVNDLSGDWSVLALIMAPLILLASLCGLPDALNLQSHVAHAFHGDVHSVSAVIHSIAYLPAQTPYTPDTSGPAAIEPYPAWMTYTLHAVFLLITLMVNLVVLCALARKESGEREPGAIAEAIQVYRRTVLATPAFLWVWLLIFLVIGIACGVFVLPILLLYLSMLLREGLTDYYVMVPLLAPGILMWVILYFAQVALVFEDVHSWSALLRSRELMRGRFLKVGMRIVVFLAVWSGYNSWAFGAFYIASILLGPVVAVTGWVWGTVFVLDLLSVSVAYFTKAFLLAAGVRLYQDLAAMAKESVAEAREAALQATAPLSGAAGR
jgi:hypothetical protein